MACADIRDLRTSYGSVEILHGRAVPMADGDFATPVAPSPRCRRARHWLEPEDTIRPILRGDTVPLLDRSTSQRRLRREARSVSLNAHGPATKLFRNKTELDIWEE